MMFCSIWLAASSILNFNKDFKEITIALTRIIFFLNNEKKKALKKVIIALIFFIFKFLKVEETYLGITHVFKYFGQ